MVHQKKSSKKLQSIKQKKMRLWIERDNKKTNDLALLKELIQLKFKTRMHIELSKD